MAVGDVYKVEIIGESDQAPVILVLHYQTVYSYGPKSIEMEGLYSSVIEAVFDKTIDFDILDFTHSSVSYSDIRIRDVDDPTQGRDDILDPIRVGVLGQDALPQQIAALARKGTSLIGRSYKGRNFLCIGNKGTLANDGQWTQGFVDGVLEWYSDLNLITSPSLPQFGFQLVIYSEKLDVATPVNSFSVIMDTRTQRRRAY